MFNKFDLLFQIHYLVIEGYLMVKLLFKKRHFYVDTLIKKTLFCGHF